MFDLLCVTRYAYSNVEESRFEDETMSNYQLCFISKHYASLSCNAALSMTTELKVMASLGIIAKRGFILKMNIFVFIPTSVFGLYLELLN